MDEKAYAVNYTLWDEPGYNYTSVVFAKDDAGAAAAIESQVKGVNEVVYVQGPLRVFHAK